MNDKFDNVYKLLSQYNFRITNDDFKCMLCKRILSNACQTVCGCNFCRECINLYISGGGVICPGDTDECEFENLSNIATDHKMNKRISKCLVECPNEMCSYQCQLIVMDEHLRICPKKRAKCPFNDIGCDLQEIVSDELNGHFQTESYNHNKMLIDVINQLKNEVTELKLESINNSKLENLKSEFQDKIESMTHDINTMKIEKEALAIEFENKNEKISLMNEEIYLIKSKNENLAQEVKSLKEDLKNISILSERKKDDEEKSKEELKVNENGMIEWIIDKVDERINDDEYIYSGYFYGKMFPYQMRLELLNSLNDIQICLFIYSSDNNSDLPWPFNADVTVEIANKNDLSIKKILTRHCIINEPQKRSYNYSEPFIFSYMDLSVAGVMPTNTFSIKCQINLI